MGFLKEFLPLQKPPNFQLVADELESRLGFKRHRQSVAAFVRIHFPNLISQPEPRPKARRRGNVHASANSGSTIPPSTNGGLPTKSKPSC